MVACCPINVVLPVEIVSESSMNMRGMVSPAYQSPSCACATEAPPNARQAAAAAATPNEPKRNFIIASSPVAVSLPPQPIAGRGETQFPAPHAHAPEAESQDGLGRRGVWSGGAERKRERPKPLPKIVATCALVRT